MNYLLTSGGVTNSSIRAELVNLLGKPIEEASALIVPTSMHALERGPWLAWQQITGTAESAMCESEWKSIGVLELTSLPSLKPELWQSWVRSVDAILVGGGDPSYLAYWMRQSGLAEFLPQLSAEKVYVGLSAGSMVTTPDFGGGTYGGVGIDIEDRTGLGFVDFAIYPHLEHEMFPNNTLQDAQRWSTKIGIDVYAIDDASAVSVVDGTVSVISQGTWKRCIPGSVLE